MRLVLCLLLVIAAMPAWAERMAMGETQDAIMYIDPTSIRKNGDRSRVWAIQKLKQRDVVGQVSRRNLMEFDSNEEKFRVLTASDHSGPMATGATRSQPAGSLAYLWEYLRPGSAGGLLMKAAGAE